MARNGQQEELRRAARVQVCCRVDVRQPHTVWTAVTQDLSVRGCRVAAPQSPRLGTRVRLTLSSDLFPEELSTAGEVVWASGGELGILFVRERRLRRGSLTPEQWVKRVLLHGRASEAPSPASAGAVDDVLPVVRVAADRHDAIPISPRRRSG
jgi:hypothetical protein